MRGESVNNLVGFLPNELEDLAVELGASRYRGRQLGTWIYRKSVFDLDTMSDLPKDFRARLAERATIHVPEPERVTASQDGSRKLVFRLGDGSQRVTHIVFMGMGEPLANYAALVQTLRILTDAKLGLGYSPRRITVSTVGLVPGIEKLGRENLKVNLAISLHAASDEVRSQLMPVNRAWNLATLIAAVKKYPLAPRQRVFFEYVMLDGINDSPEDARRLARLLRGVRAKVNLIPFNDWDGATFRRPPLARILAFQSILLDTELTTTVRWS